MPKTAFQKMRVLYVRDILLRETDRYHGITIKEIMSELAALGIEADRRSIYDDVANLNDYGYEIIQEPRTFYKVISREFEPEEVEALEDMVLSSHSLTVQKSRELLRKLSALKSRHRALPREQFFLSNRIKTMNESVYSNVRLVREAIGGDRQLSFRYFKYNAQKRKVYRPEKGSRTVSPYAVLWVEGNYYLLAYNSKTKDIRHFRIDRMERIRVLGDKREGREEFNRIKIEDFQKKVFSMYGGDEELVRVRFRNDLAELVLDRFGMDTMLIPDDADHFVVTLDVIVSPQFYAWLFACGPDAEILTPLHVRKEYRNRLEELKSMYGE